MTVGIDPATPTVVSAGKAGNDGFSVSLLVFCQKRRNNSVYPEKGSFAPWTLQTTLLQSPWACDCLLFKGFELVKVATRVTICSFGMLLMALDKILSSFMPTDIFTRNVKKITTARQPVDLDGKQGVCVVSGAATGKTFLFTLISPHFQVELILSELFNWLWGECRHLSKCSYLMTVDRWMVNKVVPVRYVKSL